MKYIPLLISVMLPILGLSQVKISYAHCNCIDLIDALEPKPEGEYVRTCNGQLIEKGSFINGNKTGTWESYSMTGKKIREFNYNASGMLDGAVRAFYSDGTIKLTGSFTNNRKDGTWSFYNNKGKLQKQGSYQNGKAVGIWNYYDTKGKKVLISYDFTESRYLKNDLMLRHFSDGEIIQNDNKGHWYILLYPDMEKGSGYEPIEPLGLLIDQYVNLLEVPVELWDTYVQKNLKSTIIFSDGVVVDIQVTEVNGHLDGVTTLPFVIITNDDHKLRRVEHQDFSFQLLRHKIREALFLLGPLHGQEGDVILYTPFILNELKGR